MPDLNLPAVEPVCRLSLETETRHQGNRGGLPVVHQADCRPGFTGLSLDGFHQVYLPHRYYARVTERPRSGSLW